MHLPFLSLPFPCYSPFLPLPSLPTHAPELEGVKDPPRGCLDWHADVEDLAAVVLVGVISVLEAVAAEIGVHLPHDILMVSREVECSGT